jgi:hypothetical protein
MILGHLAVSALLHRYLDADLKPVIAAGLFPDVVDKLLCQVLRLTPSGRMYAHTLLSVGLSTAVVHKVCGRRTARAWALGYLGHLVADAEGRVPWLYPFREYDFTGSEPGLFQIVRKAMLRPTEVGFEAALLVWAAYALSGRPSPSELPEVLEDGQEGRDGFRKVQG